MRREYIYAIIIYAIIIIIEDVRTCMFVFASASMRACEFVRANLCVHVNVYTCMSVSVCLCMFVDLFACVCVRMCVYVCVVCVIKCV